MDPTSLDRPLFSICIPVKNGAGRLEHCLASVRALDYPQDRIEIIIADGRSTDRTVEIAESFGAKVLDNPEQIAASGRNIAYDAATGDFISSADDDCVLPPSWINDALAGFTSDDIAAVGGLTPIPENSGAWEKATNVIFRLACMMGYSVQSDVMPRGEVRDLPGGCVAYRRAAWQAARPFDTTFVTAEDTELHLRMFKAGQRMIFAPGFFAWHHKRTTLRGLFRQMRRFAEGRVQLARKTAESVGPLHRLLGWSLPLGAIGLAICLALSPGLILIAASLAAVGFTGAALLTGERLDAALLTPVAAVIVTAGWSTGWIKETIAPMKSTAGR